MLNRPPVPFIEVPRGLMLHMPDADFRLDQDKFARNFRSSRKGAAPGPSGMTSEHLRLLLSKPDDVHVLFRMGEQLARAQVPNVVIDATNQSHSTTVHCTFPVRNDNACWDRVRGSCVAGTYRDKPEATVMSLDGISAFDLISRKSMLEALCLMPGGEQVLLFVGMFYGAPSVLLWETILGSYTTFIKVKVATRGILLCVFCTHWASTVRLYRYRA